MVDILFISTSCYSLVATPRADTFRTAVVSWLIISRCSVQNACPYGFRGGLQVAHVVPDGHPVVQCIQFFFSKTLFDFKKSISGPIELKFSGKTPNEVLYAPIYFWGVYFQFMGVVSVFGVAYPAGFGSLKAITKCF